MIKNNPNYIRFVESWVSKDNWRDNISKPVCYSTGWVCSTNSYKLLWLYDEEYVKNENVHDHSKGNGVDATNVMSGYSKFYESDSKPMGKIKLSDIEKIYEEIKMIPEFDKKYKECYSCEGHGTVECDVVDMKPNVMIVMVKVRLNVVKKKTVNLNTPKIIISQSMVFTCLFMK